MAAFAFNEALYPDVRAAIGLDVDETSVPDTTLALPVYKGEAERFIMRNLSEAQYTDPEYADEAQYAATLYLAALVVPAIRVVISERIAGGNLQYANVDLAGISARLMEQANARLADVQIALPGPEPVEAFDNPNFFDVARRQF